MVQTWRKVTDTKTGTLWFNDETGTTVFTVMEKLKGRLMWSVKTIKGTGRPRKLKSFTMRTAATKFAMKWMKSHTVPSQAAKKVSRGALGVLRKLGKTVKKVAAEQRTPEALARKAKSRERSMELFGGKKSDGALTFEYGGNKKNRKFKF